MKQRWTSSFSLFFLIVVAMATSHCGGIVPSQSSAKRSVSHYLDSYAHKYPDSEFGKGRVKNVDVYNVTYMQRGYADVITFITLDDGATSQASFTLKKQPMGWKVDSWEVVQR